MWIWLDKTGRVKQYLTHGPSPVVGETDFQIFAYFDGLDTDYFDSATIKFKKPDQQGSTYPVLFMRKVDMPYEHMPSDGSMSLFNEANSPYTGFLFDFSDFTEGDEIVRLLDTPGLWEATITVLGAPNKVNVSGLITFDVGSSASDSESQTELTIDQILENLILSQRMLKTTSNFYLRVVDNFVSKAISGNLLVNTFTVGSVVFDETNKVFYKILTVTLNPNDDTKVFATFQKAFEYLRILEINDTNTLASLYSEDMGNTVLVKFNGRFYLAYVSGNSEYVEFEIKDLTTGKRYHSDNAVYNTPFGDAISDTYYVPGTFYTPHVSEEGVLSWTNSGGEPNPNPVSIRGPQGLQGDEGPRGFSTLGSIYFEISETGHLIMYFSNEEVNRDLHIVNNVPGSPDYWITLGTTEDKIGHMIFVYRE